MTRPYATRIDDAMGCWPAHGYERWETLFVTFVHGARALR